jgi:restriction endonuclease fold toxin 7 of polymorphic toxin system
MLRNGGPAWTGTLARLAPELVAGISRNPHKTKQRIPSRTGTAAYRIPDDQNAEKIEEVKNVKEFKVTNQINDFVANARETSRQFIVKVREMTTINVKTQEYIDENGIIVQRPIGAMSAARMLGVARVSEVPVVVEPVAGPIRFRMPIEPVIVP